VLASAERLGLERYTFVPHPVDEDKYTPGPSPLRADLDAASDRLVLYAPARHDWRDKGNDILLRGFASFARGRPDRRPLLLLTSWGAEIERSRRLVAELGVGDLVRWDPPLPKRRMIEAYRAADIVLDQFAYGTFGGVVPEAMACGRPVILAFDAALHRWCFPELPPVLDARTDAAVAARLEQLADDTGLRDRIGRDGREWVESHHGWRLVVARHRAIYEEILDRRSG